MIALHGRHVTMVIEPVAGSAPLWRHWGPPLPSDAVPGVGQVEAPLSFSLDQPPRLSLAPGFGMGWFGPSVLLAHRGGRDFTCAWDDCTITHDARAITVRLRDSVAGIAVVQAITLDPETDVMTLAATLTNDGAAPLDVQWLASAMLPLPRTSRTIRSFAGRHNAELTEHREPMPAHGWARENRRGLTGHAGPPGLFVLAEGAGWHGGDVHAVQLAWSGNHRLAVDCHDRDFILSAGEWLAPGEVQLAAGQSLSTPELLATFSPHGLNGASQNFHAAVRRRVAWPTGAMRPRPVHLNSWEGVYFDQDEARLLALAQRAAALGAERFVLDDGWFAGRPDDRSGLGDWCVDDRKYPAGLRPLADHVVALGMEFGLWVEPEMVSPDSDLYRAHPDWALTVDGRERPTARHQLVLDLGRPDVRDHLFAALDALLSDLPIAYLKWDHNRDVAPAADRAGRAAYRAQVLGAYALIDRIRDAHPAVEIEACAGGGGRIDAGIAARTHRFWTSDNLDAVSRVAIQRAFLAFMPPELMGAHVGASPAHATGRRQSIAFRAAVALPGHLGVELDPARLTERDHAVLAGAISRYKALRETLHRGATWLGDGDDGLLWQAVGTPDKLLLFVTCITPPRGRFAPLRLPMIAAVPMLVRLIELAPASRRIVQPPIVERYRGDGVRLAGASLAAMGLPLPAMTAQSVAIFAIEQSAD